MLKYHQNISYLNHDSKVCCLFYKRTVANQRTKIIEEHLIDLKSFFFFFILSEPHVLLLSMARVEKCVQLSDIWQEER